MNLPLPVLDLNRLGAGMYALTPAAGTTLAEAASVCLEHEGHRQAVLLTVTGDYRNTFTLQRLPVDSGTKACYDDLPEATEMGACGIAILVAEQDTGYTVVRRARKGGGFDYFLGTEQPLDNKVRLEVSGILSGTENQIRARVKQKRQQIAQSNATQGSLRPYAVVVEFSRPVAAVSNK